MFHFRAELCKQQASCEPILEPETYRLARPCPDDRARKVVWHGSPAGAKDGEPSSNSEHDISHAFTRDSSCLISKVL